MIATNAPATAVKAVERVQEAVEVAQRVRRFTGKEIVLLNDNIYCTGIREIKQPQPGPRLEKFVV